MKKVLALIGTLLVAVLALAGCGGQQADSQKTLKVGATAVPHAEILEVVKPLLEKDGIKLWVESGFRSYELQTTIYTSYVSREGQTAADRYSARPGHSEHQSGLAMDLNSLYASFAYTAEGKWLAANSWKYGFIIRYPKNKQSATGYIYEPWHVRYLGKGLAAAVYDSGLCLEEYFGITSRYS